MVTPHTDIMIIVAINNNFKVEMILVDDGSSVNFPPSYVFIEKGFNSECLILMKSHLKGIYNSPIRFMGKLSY